MMPFSLSNKKKFILASGVLLLLLVGVILLSQGTQETGTENLGQVHTATTPLLVMNDIESVYVHTGLDITTCPSIAEQGYVYTVQLTDDRGIIERVGCGSGSPEVYAQAIAEDLQKQGLFTELDANLILEKLFFKIYDPRN